LPKKVVVVNDNSTDKTADIVLAFARKSIYHISEQNLKRYTPARKQGVQAFLKGFETLDDNYDVIVKLDADLILPNNYFKTIIGHFQQEP
jgi:glycosyltransferase involved in cell wall biosynthesis